MANTSSSQAIQPGKQIHSYERLAREHFSRFSNLFDFALFLLHDRKRKPICMPYVQCPCMRSLIRHTKIQFIREKKVLNFEAISNWKYRTSAKTRTNRIYSHLQLVCPLSSSRKQKRTNNVRACMCLNVSLLAVDLLFMNIFIKTYFFHLLFFHRLCNPHLILYRK